MVGAQGAFAALGDPGELAQPFLGAARTAEGEAELVTAGQGVGVVGAEDAATLGGDLPVHLARLLPAAQAAEVDARAVAAVERGEQFGGGGGGGPGDGRAGGPGGGGGPLARQPGGRVRPFGGGAARAGGPVSGGHGPGPGGQGPRARGRWPPGAGQGEGSRAERGLFPGPAEDDAAAQVARVGGPLLGGLGEQVEDDAVEEAGQVGTVGAQRFRRGVAVSDEHGPGVVLVERRYPGGDFVQDAAQRVEVAAVVDLLAADLLGRHVVRGAHGEAGGGEAGGHADVMAEARYAEVTDLHRAVGQPHDVGGLEGRGGRCPAGGCSRGRRRPVPRCRHGRRAAGAAGSPPGAG